MVNYILMEVSLHNVDLPAPQVVVEKVKTMLVSEFKPDYEIDVDVELIESA